MNREQKAWYEAIAVNAEYIGQRWHYYYGELAAMLRFIIPPNVSVAQIGPGTGDLLAQLPGKSRTGIECSETLSALVRKRHPDTDLIEDDFWALTTKRKFDYVLVSEIIDSLLEVEVVLREAHKLLRDDGRIVVVGRSFLWLPLFSLARKLFGKTQSPFRSLLRLPDLENALYLAGFEVIRSGRGILCPVYIPFVSFLCNRVLAHLPLVSRLCVLQYVVARPLPLKSHDCSVSVIVAARNEEGNIKRLLERVPVFGKSVEVVFVEGHSQDRTWEELQLLSETYRGPHRVAVAKQDGKGKWDAVKKGFSLATGDLLMILDADMTVPPEDLPRFYRAFVDSRGEFINGSRFIYPKEKGAMRFLNNLGNRFFATMVGVTVRERLTDTLCGTKVLRRSDYERIASAWGRMGPTDPFGDFELLFGASKLNLRIVELPVRYRDRSYGTTQIHRFRDGLILLKLSFVALFRFRFRI